MESFSKFGEVDTNTKLIDKLKIQGIVKDPLIEQALKTTDRIDFLPSGIYPSLAYEDRPLPIGYGATISAPHMHAHALVLMKIDNGNII